LFRLTAIRPIAEAEVDAATINDERLGARAALRCDLLGSPPYSEGCGQLTRRFLTREHRATLDALSDWMVEAGMTVRLDAAANLIGRYEGASPAGPALMIGSHVDSVRNGGRYDGMLGVLLGVDCVELLHRQGRRLAVAIEVIAFGDEEGSRFASSMICSRAVAGALDASVLDMRDAEGVSLADAFSAFGMNLADIAAAARGPREVIAFLEAHIEQGPVLEAEDLPVGIVTTIAAQRRLLCKFTGIAAHAGTTPMGLRRDPGPAAAEAILALERLCAAGSGGLVGTVGRVSATPGAFNVIPGVVELSMDVRAETSMIRDAAIDAIVAEAEAIAARRDLGVTIEHPQSLPESPCDPALVALLEAAATSVGVRARGLPSGAGHDAMVMAGLCPTAMLFIRCRGGISHNPAEAVRLDDCHTALRVMLAFIEGVERNVRS
jgi:allantoate deiminase